ncbi:MAG: amino acid adenylation domain-containing protein [Pseudomonadales bacterium]|nr:amino acid adenylation domain-containing protein [Pseudomonadales bacterium]
MDKFPLNSNGKVDRKALPNPTDSAFVNGEQVNGQGHTSETTVETATEKQLATLWGELLGKPVTSNNANFFDLGGHSLMAARLLARIEQLFDTKLNLKALFEHPTIGQFATFIENESSKSNQVIIKPWNRNKIDHLPLSYGQKRQWILASLEPDSPFYNIPAAVKLSGSLNQEALQQSLHQVFKRHENLRCSFHGTEHDPIAINNAIDAPAISFHSTSNEDENNVRLQLQTAAMRPFDLSKPPLLRMTVISSPQNQHVVLVVMHHILADAWSMQIFMTELYQNYKMLVSNPMVDSSQLNKLTLQYADFALWQQQQSEQQSYKDSLNYWRNQLADSPVLLDLPTDFHRPASQQFSGSSVNFTLTPQQTQKIQLQANYLQVTPFVLLLSLFKWLLHRYSESQDIVVGTPVGHRPHPDLENVIGLFANTLALRSRITGTETLAELVTTVRDVTFQGFEHQQVPFDQIVDELNVPRNWAHAPLVQVMFLWQSQSSHSLDKQTGEDSWLPFPLEHQQSKFDITLSLAEVESKIPVENATPQDTTEKHIVGKMEFRTDLYRRETISYMVDAFNQLINAALANPDKPLASHSLVSDQINRQLAQWNSTDSLIEYWRNTATQANDFGLSEYSNLIAPFQHQAHKSPNNIALEYYHQQWTYGQLDHQSNQLAHEIKRQCHFNGENPEVTIAVALPRDPRMIIAMIAILKSGAAYVPLDLNYPQERLKLILADAQPQLIIGAKPLIEEKNTSDNPLIGLTENLTINVIQLPELLPDTVLYSDLDTPTLSNTGNDKNQIAYLIYTSGSTGKPKGVTIEHQQALALINWANQTFSPQQIKGTLAATSICFDLSVFEIFVPLAMGGAIILAENALAIPELPNRNNISLINTVPSAAAELVRMKAIPDSTLVINLAGEPLSANLVRQLYENSRANAVFNLYGPSEDTTYSTGVRLARDIPLDQTVSIGRPILNTQSYVLDQHQRLIVPGMVGELYLGGAGITRGYWRQPEITAEGFIASPFGCSNRLYRTGDRVRLRHDGELEFLGRLDHQVKIRGFRIETGEIESALETHPSIQQAVVVVIEKQLTAYLRFKRAESTDASVTELRNHLMKNLPQYMIPAYFYAIDVFPSLPNGKTNRGLLTHASYTENCVLMGSAQQESGTSGDLIDSTTYQGLLQIWQKLLNRTDINPTDHFFELGGDSILAIQMITQARHQNIHLEPKDLFQYSTLETLSAFYQQSGQRQKQVIDQTPLEGEVPLLPIHHWFFEQQFHYPEHWNQTLLLKVNQAIDVTLLRKALLLVANSNDALRANFKADFIDPTTGQATHWRQFINPLMAADAVPLHSIKRSFNKTDCSEGKTPEAFIEAESNQWQAAFDLNQGPLWNILYFDLDKTTEENDSKPESIRRLLIVAHHLVIDGISWRIFLEDLQSAYLQLLNRIDLTTQDESKASLTPRTHNMVHFVSNLERVLPTFEEQRAYWQAQCAHDQARWILRAELLNQDKNDSMSHSDTITVELKGVDTQRWLKGLPQAYKILSDELLFAAVSKVLLDWNDSEKLAFMLEGHGREGLANVDLTRTFGWFTSMYPLLISAPKTQSTDEFLKSVKSSLRAVPNQGASYGALRWLSKNSQDQSLLSRANVRFNYLGQTDNLFSDDALLTPATESAGKARNPNEKREMLLDINALVAQGTLRIHWSYSKLKFQESTIQSLAHQTLDTLQYFIDHCMSDTHDGGLVPEDFPEMDLANDELDALLDNI